MVSLAIADGKVSAFCSSMMDEQLREVIILLSDGPLNTEKTAEILGIGLGDSEERLERLVFEGLVRKTLAPGGALIYSLDFSMERLGKAFDMKTAGQLAIDLSKALYAFLESHAEEVTALCESTGISPARAVEQLFLASFSSVMIDLKSEVAGEDKAISKALGKDRAKK